MVVVGDGAFVVVGVEDFFCELVGAFVVGVVVAGGSEVVVVVGATVVVVVDVVVVVVDEVVVVVGCSMRSVRISVAYTGASITLASASGSTENP